MSAPEGPKFNKNDLILNLYALFGHLHFTKIRNEEYKNYTKDHSVNQFMIDYKISEVYKDSLKLILKDLDADFQDSDLNNDWNFIENRIEAQIANSIWGKSAMYKVNLQMDTVAMDAFNHFSKALLLVK